MRTIETDTDALATTGSTTDATIGDTTMGNSTTIAMTSLTTTTSNGATFARTYASPGETLDVTPESPGPVASGVTPSMLVETDADGEKTSRSTNADGSYAESVAYPDGTMSTTTENADGSGTASLPLVAGSTNSTIAIGAPNANGIAIAIAYGQGTGLNDSAQTIADWFPGGSPLPLETRTLVDLGAANLPAGCVRAAVAPDANIVELRDSSTRTDVVYGELETTTLTTYTVSELGPACIVGDDFITSYYDYDGNQLQTPGFGSLPLGTSDLSEIVGVTAVAPATGATTTSVTRAMPVAAVAAARFQALVERERSERHATLRARFATRLRRGTYGAK